MEIRRRILQGGNVSPLLFVLCILPLNLVLRETRDGYEQALRVIYVKYNIDKTSRSPLCRMCGEKVKGIGTLIANVRNRQKKQKTV